MTDPRDIPEAPGSLDAPGPSVEPGSLDAPGPSVEPGAPGSLDAPGPSVEPGAPGSLDAPPGPPTRTPRAGQGETPLYKGEPLNAERGPGLGCFWIQIALLGFLLVLTPLTVVWAWDERISAVLLILTLILLLFAGQTVIFLLRLVAADRRSRRVPRSATARRTVGMLEDESIDPGAPADTGAPDEAAAPDEGAGPDDTPDRPPG
jgi:hypothetical protein